jgi:membrane-associated phospholipid phosphatase
VDFRVFHAVNAFVGHHEWLADGFGGIEATAPIALALATAGLWLLARPGANRKWKLASASALAAGTLGLLVNQVISHLWDRPRPYEAHAGVQTWVTPSHDPSFPSDHASAAFGIAFAVLMFDRWAGALFVSAAALIGFGRVLVGVHYPGDVLAGMLVGLGCAALAVKLLRPVLGSAVRLVERVTDPLLAPLWRRLHSR